MTQPAWFPDWELCTHRGPHSSAPPPPPQFKISLLFHMQSNRVVDGTDDCEMAGQRVQQPRITFLSLTEDDCYCYIAILQVLAHLALKVDGRQHSDWFDLCCDQNTPPWLIPSLNTTSLHSLHFAPRISDV